MLPRKEDESILPVPGEDAGHRAPPFPVYRLEHFAPVHHAERTHEAGKLTGLEEMILRSGPPAEQALGDEKRFDHEEAAGSNELADLRQSRPVKIIEHQNRIKRSEVGPRFLEIHKAPFDGETLPVGQLARPGNLGFIPVHGNHRGTGLRCGKAVPPFPTGQIQHPGSGAQ